MRVSSRSLASALVRRLEKVLPASFRLTAAAYVLELRYEGQLDTTIFTLDIVDDESRELRERLKTAVWGVLNSIQDGVVEHLRAPWPSRDGREMADPGVRFDGSTLHLWYGEREEAALVRMPPIPLTEIAE